LVTYGHALIDKAFSTNQGPEVKANAEAFAKKFGYEPSIGVLLPPSKMLNNVAKTGEKIAKAEKASATVVEIQPFAVLTRDLTQIQEEKLLTLQKCMIKT
jgi:hypothetical protein